MTSKSKSAKSLVGAHLNNEDDDDVSPYDGVLKITWRALLKSVAWLSIYAIGYYGFSAAWLVTPLLATVLRAHWKRNRDARLSAARHAALGNEKEMIESRIRVEDMPSWVFFPDKERAEWINTVVQRLWPNVGHFVRKTLMESVEPAVAGALDAYGLKGFRFERVVLGNVPPRITGIKVYEKNVGRNEIILDVDVIFASDCDIKICVGKIKAKIMDFSLRGLLRVVLKPLVVDMPLVGGLQAYFLTPPDIDFDLGGVANAFDAPGLSSVIRSIVLEQIGYYMVLPHKFTLSLVDGVETKTLRCPDSAGVLRVRVHKAVQLLRKDVGVLGMGKSDPYAVLTVGARTVKTHRIDNTVNPEWNFLADFPIEVVRGQQLTVEIMDHDDPGEDEFLGRATVQTSVVASKGQVNDMWIDLEDVTSGRVLLSLSWLQTSLDVAQLERFRPKEELPLAKCVMHVYIDCCSAIFTGRTGALKPSPMVELKLGQETQSTFPQTLNSDPVFEQGFVFLVANPAADDLHVRVIDTKAKKNTVIGFYVLRLSDMLSRPKLEVALQPFPLAGGHAGATITLAANIRCLTEPKKLDDSQCEDDDEEDEKPAVEEKPASPTTKAPLAATPSAATPTPATVASPKPDPGMTESKSSTLSMDEMISSTIKPLVETTGNNVDMADLLNPLNVVRKRVAGSCGKIRLNLLHDGARKRLRVVVMSAANLPPGANPNDPPDPYVKLYLLPDKSRKSKRKTEVVKDSTSPVYDEVFDYDGISQNDLGSIKLQVTVLDKKSLFTARRSPALGRVVVDLANPAIFGDSGLTEWFGLNEVEGDSSD